MARVVLVCTLSRLIRDAAATVCFHAARAVYKVNGVWALVTGSRYYAESLIVLVLLIFSLLNITFFTFYFLFYFN